MDIEIMGAWKAVKYCENEGLNNMILETDSLTLKNIISNKWRTPWAHASKIVEIQRTISKHNIQVHHVFREANKLADYFANLALEQHGLLKFMIF